MRIFLVLLGLIAGVVTPASAHQQKAAITKVLFNPQTKNLEVMHRFYLHDAEHAVKEIFGKKADIMKSKDTQQTFSDYVAKRFILMDENKQPLPLKSVGFEIEGRFFWVYQETVQPTEVNRLYVKHHALRDLWQSQFNTVNFEGNGKLKTLNFDGSQELLTVDFSPHHEH